MNQPKPPRPFGLAAGRAAHLANELETHILRRYRDVTPQEVAMAFATVTKKMDLMEAKRTRKEPDSIRAMQDFLILLCGGLQAVDFTALHAIQAEIEAPDSLPAPAAPTGMEGDVGGGLVITTGTDEPVGETEQPHYGY